MSVTVVSPEKKGASLTRRSDSVVSVTYVGSQDSPLKAAAAPARAVSPPPPEMAVPEGMRATDERLRHQVETRMWLAHREATFDRRLQQAKRAPKRTSSVASVVTEPSPQDSPSLVRVSSHVSEVTVTPEPAPKKAPPCSICGGAAPHLCPPCGESFCPGCSRDEIHCIVCYPPSP